MKFTPTFILLLIFATACNFGDSKPATLPEIANADPVEVPPQDGLERAYFASGCFWCVEAVYESVQGVKEAISGYSGGHTENPTYEQSNTGTTGHAEAVEVIYDPEVVDFETLARVYFGSMDPTQKNGQGPDIGSQYRSIIFFQNEQQKQTIEEVMEDVQQEYQEPLAVEVLPFQKFWEAEAYHQDYKRKNPNDPYIRGVSAPRLERFKQKFPELLKENQG